MNDNDDNLKGKTQKALAWSFADKFGQQLLYFISGVILARILNAEDYGKTGVLAIFIALAGILIDSGFASALIRKKNATQADYSTIFYFNLGFSLVLYAILFFSAPYIAIFFDMPHFFSHIAFQRYGSYTTDFAFQKYLFHTMRQGQYIFSCYIFGHCNHFSLLGSRCLGFGCSNSGSRFFQGSFLLVLWQLETYL